MSAARAALRPTVRNASSTQLTTKDFAMNLNAHLNFSGNCAEALRFYEQHLGAQTTFTILYGSSPMANQFPADFADKIMHATISIGGTSVLVADSPPGFYQQPAGFCISLSLSDPAEAERIFNALAHNGTVTMPLQATFWAKQFGMVTDQFGIPWMLNCGDAEPNH
jgi:PhnB protein